MRDIRDIIFHALEGKRFRAVLTAERAGVLSGVDSVRIRAEELGIALELCKEEGEELSHGERIGTLVAVSWRRLVGLPRRPARRCFWRMAAPESYPAPGKRCPHRLRNWYAARC